MAHSYTARHFADFYPTPAWATAALLEHCPPPSNLDIVEPAAGEGHICRVLLMDGNPNVHAVELRDIARPELEKLLTPDPIAGVAGLKSLTIGNWFDVAKQQQDNSFSAITNPPFDQALPFAQSLVVDLHLPYVALLLRLGFLASRKRYPFLSTYPPDAIVVLSKRPSFTGDGKTDSYDYGWFVWEVCGPRGLYFAK